MAVDSYNPVTGAPQFSGSGAPDIAVDPTEVAKYAADVGNSIIRANFAALDAYGYKRAGLRGVALDTGFTYEHDGSGWLLVRTDIFGRVTRADTSISMSTSAWVDTSPNANWSADTARGITPYNNGWVIPVSGRYQISYELRASGAFGAGVSVNLPTPSTTDVFLAMSAASIQGVIGFASNSGVFTLTAGDVVRLLAIRDSGTPSLSGLAGYWSVEWTGRL